MTQTRIVSIVRPSQNIALINNGATWMPGWFHSAKKERSRAPDEKITAIYRRETRATSVRRSQRRAGSVRFYIPDRRIGV